MVSVLRIPTVWFDPDPRIHASDKWIRIRILLFSSLTFKMPTIFHDDRRIRIRIQEAQKHTDLTGPDPDSDPDPQH
jgi:hypothetical protein